MTLGNRAGLTSRPSMAARPGMNPAAPVARSAAQGESAIPGARPTVSSLNAAGAQKATQAGAAVPHAPRNFGQKPTDIKSKIEENQLQIPSFLMKK